MLVINRTPGELIFVGQAEIEITEIISDSPDLGYLLDGSMQRILAPGESIIHGIDGELVTIANLTRPSRVITRTRNVGIAAPESIRIQRGEEISLESTGSETTRSDALDPHE